MSVTCELDADLDITVSRYLPLSECPGFTASDIASFQLPKGFPILVSRRSGQIIEPVFRYIYERVKGYARYPREMFAPASFGRERSARQSRPRQIRLDTATAAADNLRLWFGYLAFVNKAWNKIGAQDILSYSRGLGIAVSPRTGDLLTKSTINQRLTHVLEFFPLVKCAGRDVPQLSKFGRADGGQWRRARQFAPTTGLHLRGMEPLARGHRTASQ